MTGCIPCCRSEDPEEQELVEPTDDPALCTCRGREYRYHPKKGAVCGTAFAVIGVVAAGVMIWGGVAIGWESNDNNNSWQRIKWMPATILVLLGTLGGLATLITTCVFSTCLFQSDPVVENIALDIQK